MPSNFLNHIELTFYSDTRWMREPSPGKEESNSKHREQAFSWLSKQNNYSYRLTVKSANNMFFHSELFEV